MRQAAIKCLPDLCKNNSNKELCTKVADVLTQLLVSGNIIIIIIIIIIILSLCRRSRRCSAGQECNVSNITT